MQFYDVAAEQDNEPPSPVILLHGTSGPRDAPVHAMPPADPWRQLSLRDGESNSGLYPASVRVSSGVRAHQTGVLRLCSWFKLLIDPRPRGKDCNNLKLLKMVTFEEGQGVGKMSVKQSHTVL